MYSGRGKGKGKGKGKGGSPLVNLSLIFIERSHPFVFFKSNGQNIYYLFRIFV